MRGAIAGGCLGVVMSLFLLPCGECCCRRGRGVRGAVDFDVCAECASLGRTWSRLRILRSFRVLDWPGLGVFQGRLLLDDEFGQLLDG